MLTYSLLLFGSSRYTRKVFKCIITGKDDKAKTCVLSVLSCFVKRSSKTGIKGDKQSLYHNPIKVVSFTYLVVSCTN